MALAISMSRAQQGMDAPQVLVEVYISGGLPGTAIVGLPEAAVREARDRVRVAIQSIGFQYPRTRVTVNLAPAELPKTGGRFDLAIALGVLAAAGQVPSTKFEACEFYGELALSGQLRPVRGLLPALIKAREDGRTLVVPKANQRETALIEGADIYVAETLMDVCAWLKGGALARPDRHNCAEPVAISAYDLADVNGQGQARRALEIAAAGNHHMLFTGPPGTGKTMLAERLAGILPPLDDQQALSSCAVRSIAGVDIDVNHWHYRPFRAPHHTASAVALVGGGSQPRPGEISLAHHGILFLDELPEFSRHVLEVLREPLESGRIVISRAAQKVSYPARFQLVAAMNPCPCGYAGDSDGRCHCTREQIERYRGRISGPLWDRIDMHVKVPRIPLSELMQNHENEASHIVAKRVLVTRHIQQARQNKLNSQLAPGKLEVMCKLSQADKRWLETSLESLRLSARAYHRVLRVARTIADMDNASDEVERMHLAEAIQFRRMDSA